MRQFQNPNGYGAFPMNLFFSILKVNYSTVSILFLESMKIKYLTNYLDLPRV